MKTLARPQRKRDPARWIAAGLVHGFRRVQGSLYVTDNEDMANLFLAIQALRTNEWFPKSVRDIRAFRIEQWSDFTSAVKSRERTKP